MTPQELKNSVLQLAIQGKLVEQRSEEGTAEELYRQIQDEKQRLIKAGTLKKEKPLPEITEDEIPFDIPESWKWVRLGVLGQLRNGYAFKSADYTTDGIQVVRISDLGEDVIETKDSVFYTPADDLSAYLIVKDSFLICMTGSIGKMAWVTDEIPRYLNQRVGMFIPYKTNDLSFLWYFLHTPYVINGWIRAKTSANGNIKTANITELAVPLPPLAEQRRIAARIGELLPHIDRYEQAWSRLEEFNERFPDDMKRSVLQLAIQGRLVERRAEEGTAEELYQRIQAEKQRLVEVGKIKKEKPLPKIAEDEMPFEIPDSWKWVRLCEIGHTQTGNTPSKSHPEYVGKNIPFITPGDILDGHIAYDNQALSAEGKEVARICGQDSILQVCIGGSIGKAAITNREVAFNQQINSITPVLCNSRYIYAVMTSSYFIAAMKETAGGTATPIINRGLWDKLLLPFPPLAEQKRIVARLEELLPLCERLQTRS